MKTKLHMVRLEDKAFISIDHAPLSGQIQFYVSRNPRKRYGGNLVNDSASASIRVQVESAAGYYSQIQTIPAGGTLEFLDFPLSGVTVTGTGATYSLIAWASKVDNAYVRRLSNFTNIPNPLPVSGNLGRTWTLNSLTDSVTIAGLANPLPAILQDLNAHQLSPFPKFGDAYAGSDRGIVLMVQNNTTGQYIAWVGPNGQPVVTAVGNNAAALVQDPLTNALVTTNTSQYENFVGAKKAFGGASTLTTIAGQLASYRLSNPVASGVTVQLELFVSQFGVSNAFAGAFDLAPANEGAAFSGVNLSRGGAGSKANQFVSVNAGGLPAASFVIIVGNVAGGTSSQPFIVQIDAGHNFTFWQVAAVAGTDRVSINWTEF